MENSIIMKKLKIVSKFRVSEKNIIIASAFITSKHIGASKF